MKVSIIIPTYNYSNFIIYAIKSIENQTYPKNLIEIIIIDDGSNDGTDLLIKSYTSSVKIKYVYQKNLGKAVATQQGINLSSGDIIFNLDADDYFFSEKIQSVVEIYKKYPEVVHVGHAAKITYEDKKIEQQENIPENITDKQIDGNFLLNYFLRNRLLFGGGSTFSAKKEILIKNLIPPQVDMYIDEYLIFATTVYGKSYLLKKPLSAWRIHGNNYSVNNNHEALTLKNQRLIKSSIACLNFIESNPIFSKSLKNIYLLKHLDRILGYKELNKEKTYFDVYDVLKTICSGKYSVTLILRYRLINRLLPTWFLKKIKAGKKNL